MNICVFCSSSNGIADSYFDAAIELGEMIAVKKHQLVYGGAMVGLMGSVAKSVLSNGGYVSGIIPEVIHDKELAFKECNELIITKDLRERKHIMSEKADAFIALPGGFGTMEEIIEVITLKQLEIHLKPIVFININNFYQHFIQYVEHAIDENFIKSIYKNLFYIAENVKDAMNYIENYQYEIKESKWYKVNINN